MHRHNGILHKLRRLECRPIMIHIVLSSLWFGEFDFVEVFLREDGLVGGADQTDESTDLDRVSDDDDDE